MAFAVLDKVRSRTRRWVPVILAFWALTFVLNVLAPCCEAVAASHGTDHSSVPARGSGHALDAVVLIASNGALPSGESELCPSLDKVDYGLVEALIVPGDNHPYIVSAPGDLGGDERPHTRPVITRPWSLVCETGPPAYLSTQRFRI